MSESMNEKLLVTISPHVFASDDVRSIMRSVVLALLPACAFGVLFFGLPALWVILSCVASCIASEYFCQRLRGVEITIGDYSAMITGLLLAMNLPATTPLWMAALGGIIAIVIGKQVFGGLGNNPFNPALLARIVLLVAFPVHLTARWPVPVLPNDSHWLGSTFSKGVDVVTAATPLNVLKGQGVTAALDSTSTYLPHGWIVDGLLGFRGGCLGEGAVIALLLGAAYLLYRRIITWHIPFSYIGTVFVLTGAAWLYNPAVYVNPFFHLIYGGLILGAFFMATDMVTSPVTKTGQILFGVGAGVVVVLIRFFGGYPEGVAFSILLMNALVPFLDKIRPRGFGVAVPASSSNGKGA